MRGRESERERGRQTDRSRETETETERQKDRQTALPGEGIMSISEVGFSIH